MPTSHSDTRPGQDRPALRVLGRYALYEEIAAGGMASVHLARLLGTAGFTRTVAIKRLHAHLARDPEFVAMFLDEARLAARIRHPNVIPTLDVVATDGELFLVMEYVQGESLQRLFRVTRTAGTRIPTPIAVSIACGILHGLHAAHEATNERGEPLGLVHRDVSPQNVLVGVDGVARVLDFGIAKALGRLQSTAEGQLKGKISYMAPEQIRQGEVSRRTDVFAASIVLWEALAGRKLFDASNEGELVLKMVDAPVPSLRAIHADLPTELEAVVRRGLEKDPAKRFASAHEMARALEETVPVVSGRAVGEWVRSIAPESLAHRARQLERIETVSSENEGLLVAMLAAQPSGDHRAARAAELEPLHAPPRWSKEAETVAAPSDAEDAGVDPRRPPRPIADPMSDSPVTADSRGGRRSRAVVVALTGLAAGGALAMLWAGFRRPAPPEASVETAPAPAIAVSAPMQAPTESAAPPAVAEPPATSDAPVASAEQPVRARPPPPKPGAARHAPVAKPSTAAPSAAPAKRPEDYFGRD